MQVVYDGLRSPTEFESTPIIAHVLQEYFLRFMGRYREFVQPEGSLRDVALASDDPPQSGPSFTRMSGDIRARPSFRHSPKAAAPGAGPRAGADDDGYLRCCPPCFGGSLLSSACEGCQCYAEIQGMVWGIKALVSLHMEPHSACCHWVGVVFIQVLLRGLIQTTSLFNVLSKHGCGAGAHWKLSPARIIQRCLLACISQAHTFSVGGTLVLLGV